MSDTTSKEWQELNEVTFCRAKQLGNILQKHDKVQHTASDHDKRVTTLLGEVKRSKK